LDRLIAVFSALISRYAIIVLADEGIAFVAWETGTGGSFSLRRV